MRAPRYLRFVVDELHPASGYSTGIVHAAGWLARAQALEREGQAHLERHLRLLDEWLPVPTRFSRKRNAAHRNTRGLSWVKDTSADVIAVLRALADVLECSGRYRVTTLVTLRPGYVTYEDDHQVVAEPFAGTPTR